MISHVGQSGYGIILQQDHLPWGFECYLLYLNCHVLELIPKRGPQDSVYMNFIPRYFSSPSCLIMCMEPLSTYELHWFNTRCFLGPLNPNKTCDTWIGWFLSQFFKQNLSRIYKFLDMPSLWSLRRTKSSAKAKVVIHKLPNLKPEPLIFSVLNKGSIARLNSKGDKGSLSLTPCLSQTFFITLLAVLILE